MKKEEVLKKIKNHLIVSCQGGHDEGNSFYTSFDMLQMATAAKLGGCVAFRANTPENVSLIKRAFPDMPMIGIWKIIYEGSDVYITPTMESVDTLVDIGCEIVALDATHRKNHLGKYAWELIPEIKAKYPDLVVMADIATLEDATYASKAGADIISTTLSGYTEKSLDRKISADFQLIKDIRAHLNVFINAEGRLWTREDALHAFECGADTVVIGTAITSPLGITKRFVSYIESNLNKE